MPSRSERRAERRAEARAKRRRFLLDASALLELYLPGSVGQSARSRTLVHLACVRGAAIGAVQWLEVVDKLRQANRWTTDEVLQRLSKHQLVVEPVTEAVANAAAEAPHASSDRSNRLFLAAMRLRGGHGLVAGEKRMRGSSAAGSAAVQSSGYLIDVRDPQAQLP